MFVGIIIINMKNIEKVVKLPKLDSSLFTWTIWNADSITALDLKCRYDDITSEKGKSILNLYATGWCYGENLICRPKANEIALMCDMGEGEFWFHLRKAEFLQVFKK